MRSTSIVTSVVSMWSLLVVLIAFIFVSVIWCLLIGAIARSRHDNRQGGGSDVAAGRDSP